MTEIILQGERLFLLPERAVWWPSEKTILLSDLHWGKSGHFRKHGIPMPGGTQDQDGIRLADIISKQGAGRLIIAGDLFHSHYNKEVDDFTYWRNAHPQLQIDFVMGNHDILAQKQYEQWRLTIYKEGMTAGPFYIAHDNTQDPARFTIHGHIHPGIRISGVGRQALSLPCFCINKTCMVLPAFGGFTGSKLIKPADYQQVYVIGDGKVIRWL